MEPDTSAYEEYALKLSDPQLRDLLADHSDLIGVMELQRCLFRSIGHLDLGPESFGDYIREVVGGPYVTHKFVASGLAYYLNSDLQLIDDREQFNRVATMLLADAVGHPLAEAVPVFGTVMITGFDSDTWLPHPLPHEALMAAFDQMLANERAAEVARGIIYDTPPGTV